MKYLALLLPLFLMACEETAEERAFDSDEFAGRAFYLENCAACHGDDAKGGDSALAASLEKPAPDLTKIAARNGGVYPRDKTMSVIDGLQRIHGFSPAMPTFGELDLGPLIIVEENGVGTPIPSKLLAVSNYLESIQE